MPFGTTAAGATFNPGQAGFVMVDVTFEGKATKLPKRISHRLTVTLRPEIPSHTGTYRTAPTQCSPGLPS